MRQFARRIGCGRGCGCGCGRGGAGRLARGRLGVWGTFPVVSRSTTSSLGERACVGTRVVANLSGPKLRQRTSDRFFGVAHRSMRRLCICDAVVRTRRWVRHCVSAVTGSCFDHEVVSNIASSALLVFIWRIEFLLVSSAGNP